MKRFLFVAIIFFLTASFTSPVLAQCVQQFPPGDGGKEPGATITSADGNVSIGVSQRYGGAITYLRDTRLGRNGTAPDYGNLIDYGQGGALFTTAIWTIPPNNAEVGYCWPQQKQNGTCPGTIPFNNPTQGGYLADGCAGNPNTTSVAKNGNKISTSYRMVNYNYAWNNPNTPLTDANKSQWQTDFYGDMDIYFHPTIPDVIVLDQKFTYCKQGGCAPILTQDNQLSTFFGAGTFNSNPNYQGPLGRSIFRSSAPNYKNIFALNDYSNSERPNLLGLGLNYYPYENMISQNFSSLGYNLENWGAVLYKSQDKGIGFSILNYYSIDPVPPYHSSSNWSPSGYNSGKYPTLNATQPQLNKFETHDISINLAGTGDWKDITRFKFNPGSWYKFRTFVSTGDLDKIRWDLIRAQDPNYLEGRTITYDSQVDGYADVMTCSVVQGWAKKNDDSARRLLVRADIYPDGDYGSKVSKTAMADSPRSDLGSICAGGSCAYSISVGSLPSSFTGKKLHVDVYAGTKDTAGNMSSQGRLKFSTSNIISCTGSGGGAPSNTPVVTNTAAPVDDFFGDVTGDGHVDLADFAALISHLGNTNYPAGDLNNNSKVDIFDFAIVIASFGQSH